MSAGRALQLNEKARRKRYDACDELELMVGIEPTTFSLRVRCSAIEPHQRIRFSGLAAADHCAAPGSASQR